jgi:hypothetical protein
MLRGLALAASLSSFAWSSTGDVEGWQTPVGQAEAVSVPADFGATPAVRYAGFDRTRCEAELAHRSIAHARVSDARGVLAPIRLTGPLRGVEFHSVLPSSLRAGSPYEIMDCRLVLALHDFAAILAKHDVVEVIHLSAYRPPSKAWPSGRVASRHPGALALDVGAFVLRDGTRLDVEKHFHGRIGTKTCGPGTGPSPATPEATTLRNIVCEAADQRLFNVELTPDYNWQHRNHFHLEVTAGVRWFLVH